MAVADQRTILGGHGQLVGRFANDFIVQTKGRWAGQRMEVEPWQQDFFDELFLVYDDGERVYHEALVGIARKNGKSTVAAMLGLHGLLAAQHGGPEVYAAAASKDQARIVFDQAVEFIRASPRLSDWLQPQRSVITCKANGGVFRVLSSDAPLQYGLNPHVVIIDELWAHPTAELYYALTTGQLAQVSPMVVSITTAGFDRDSICYQLYKRGVRLRDEGGLRAMREAGFLMRWYEADPTLDWHDERAWRQANPSSWIRRQDLDREAKRLPESVFRRLHLNQWTETEDAWIKPYEWDACRGRPYFDLDKPLIAMAVDVGIRRDSAAITWAQWHDEDLHVGSEIMLPEVEGPSFGVSDIRNRLAGRARAHDAGVREINFDPWSFRESAEILAEAGLPLVEFPQNAARMAPASETLYELIVNRRLVHDGDAQLREQMLNAVIAPTERGGWRISKRKSLERIDVAVSLAMTADRAVSLRNVKPPRRGIVLY
jgi:phage terminase large subunit-like protein